MLQDRAPRRKPKPLILFAFVSKRRSQGRLFGSDRVRHRFQRRKRLLDQAGGFFKAAPAAGPGPAGLERARHVLRARARGIAKLRTLQGVANADIHGRDHFLMPGKAPYRDAFSFACPTPANDCQLRLADSPACLQRISGHACRAVTFPERTAFTGTEQGTGPTTATVP